MEIELLRVGSITVLQLSGRMDIINRDPLLRRVEEELERGDHNIVLNLAGISYISASGLKILRRIEEEHGAVRIADPSHRVIEMLELTGLSQYYHIYPTQPQAIHSLMPVVNAHTHLELGWMDEFRPGITGQDFTDWILNNVSQRGRALGDKRQLAGEMAAEKGVEALVDIGTTTVCDITSTGVSIEPLLLSGLEGMVYVEIIATSEEQGQARLEAARTLIDTWRPRERNGMRLGLSLHAPYSILPSVFKQGLDYARAEDLPLCIHAAESRDELAFFLHGTGPIADHNRALNMDFPAPGISPIQYLEEMGALALKPLLVHCVQIDDADIQRIQRSGAAVVHCPRSNLRLRCGRMPLEKLLAAGIPVYMGTDSLGSSPSLNIMDELEIAAALHHGHVSPDDLTRLVHQTFA